MSRKAIVITLASYFIVALVFGVFETFAPSSAFDLRPAAWIGGTIGTAIGVLVIAGLLPMIFWAIRRFRAADASGPIVSWGLIGLVVVGLSAKGTAYDEPDAMGNLSDNIASLFDGDYGAFVRSIRLSTPA